MGVFWSKWLPARIILSTRPTTRYSTGNECLVTVSIAVICYRYVQNSRGQLPLLINCLLDYLAWLWMGLSPQIRACYLFNEIKQANIYNFNVINYDIRQFFTCLAFTRLVIYMARVYVFSMPNATFNMYAYTYTYTCTYLQANRVYV